MSDKGEKKINLDELESETTSPSVEYKIEERSVDLNDLPPDSIQTPKKKSIPTLSLSEEEKAKKLDKLFMTRVFGIKQADTFFFLKPIACLGFALFCWKASSDLEAVEHPNDELMAFGYSIIVTPMLIAMYGIIASLVLYALYLFVKGKSIVYRKDFFILSYDGIEGVDAVIPDGKTFYRRKIKWSDISYCHINEKSRIPHIELCSPERKLIQLPLHVSEVKELRKALEDFCPVSNPLRLFINKFKNP